MKFDAEEELKAYGGVPLRFHTMRWPPRWVAIALRDVTVTVPCETRLLFPEMLSMI